MLLSTSLLFSGLSYTSFGVDIAHGEESEQEIKDIVGLTSEITTITPSRSVSSLSDTVSIVSDGYARAICSANSEYSANPTANEPYSITCVMEPNSKVSSGAVRITPKALSFSGTPVIGGVQSSSQNVTVEVKSCSSTSNGGTTCSWHAYPPTTVSLYMNVFEGISSIMDSETQMAESIDNSSYEFSDVDELTSDQKNGTGADSDYSMTMDYGSDLALYTETSSNQNASGSSTETYYSYANASENARTSIGESVMASNESPYSPLSSNASSSSSSDNNDSSFYSAIDREAGFNQANAESYGNAVNDLFGDDAGSLNRNYNDPEYSGTSDLDNYFSDVESPLREAGSLQGNGADNLYDIVDFPATNNGGNHAEKKQREEKFFDADGNQIDGFFDDTGAWVGTGDPSKIHMIENLNGKTIIVDYLPGAYGMTYAERASEESGRLAQLEQKVFAVLSIVDSPILKSSSGHFKDGSLSDILHDLLGNSFEGSAFDQPDTLSRQQLVKIATHLLMNRGYSLDDIKNGKNYDRGSAYTDPNKAWDFNPIPKLLKETNVTVEAD